MVALLVVSFPAQARVKDQLEDAVMKCMTDPSKMTCERAAESAGIDAKRVYNSNWKCVIHIGIIGAMAATSPFMGEAGKLFDEWNRYQKKYG